MSKSPYIISDELPPDFISHVDNKHYSSKSEYRKAMRALGLTEVGDEIEALYKLAQRKDPTEDPVYQRKLQQDLEEAYYQLRDGMSEEMSEETRERCRNIDNNLQEYNYDRRERNERGDVIE